MIGYNIRYGIFPVKVKWFEERQNKTDLLLPSVSYHVQAAREEYWGISELGHTLEICLTQSLDDLKAGMVKSYRQQIRQSEEEGVVFKQIENREELVPFYNEFASNKGLPLLTKSRVWQYGSHFQVFGAFKGDSLLAVHSCLADPVSKIVRVFHSATRRLDENFEKQLVGKANKYLHYCEMVYFKEQGFKVYDFGGIAFNTEDPSLKGINVFKTQFGGNVVESYTIYSYLYYILRSLLRFLKLRK